MFHSLKSLLKSHELWTVLGLVAWHLIYHLPVTFGQQVFSEGDILWGNLPIRAEVTRDLAQGKLPLWTPLLQAGMPLFAEGHTAALYPLNLILHTLFSPQIAISYVILFNLCWLSIGMYLFVRACSLRVSSAFFAGLVFSASGAVLARVSHLDVLTPISWMPWLLFFQVKYWRARFEQRNAYYWFVACCIAIGLQFLAGSPALIALNLIAYVLCGLFAEVLWIVPIQLVRNNFVRIVSSHLGEALLVTFSSIVIGLGLGAAQLIPTAELISWSIRGKDLGLSFFTSYSLDPAAVSQFIAPFANLGTPIADNMEFWGYFGILPLVLACVAPALRRDFRTRFFALFAILALALALGGSNPFYQFLYYVPVFNRFRVPARFLFLFLFASSFLAAIAFDELQNRLHDATKKNIFDAGAIPAIFLALGSMIALIYNLPIDFWMNVWGWLPIVLIVLSVGVLFAIVRLKPSRQIVQATVILLTCLDLAMFGAPFLSTLDRTSAPSDLAQIPRTVLAMDNHQPIDRSLVMKFPSVTSAAVRATMWSGLPMTYGRAGILTGYMPFSLALGRNEEYIKSMTRPMQNLMGIRYYLLPLEIAPPETESPFDETQPENGLTLGLLRQQPSIPPTRLKGLRVVSYTDQTAELADGFLAGELDLTLENGEHKVFPIRLGEETADWSWDGIKQVASVKHRKPVQVITFSAYLRSVGHEFAGIKSVARFDVSAVIKAIGVRSFLPGTGLTINHIDLIDEMGKSISLSTLLHRNDLTLAFRSNTAAMWDNRDVMPRAFIVHSAVMVNDEEVLAQLKDPNFDPYAQVLLDDSSSLDVVSNGARSVGDIADIVAYTSDHISIKAKTESKGYLVLTDSWFPGWDAIIDGQVIPILRANYIFRAIPLSPGEHSVEFEYRPWSFKLGLIVSSTSGVVIIVLVLVFRKHS